jgi:hypothetical protein
MLDDENYEQVCENLGLPAYQDLEHEVNRWRLYSDGELYVIMSEMIMEFLKRDK